MAQLTLPNEIVFDEHRPFYEMVSAYIIATVGLASVLDPANPMQYRKGHVVTLEEKVHQELRLEPYPLHQLAINGKISTPSMVQSLTSMLINTAWESVRSRNDHSPEFEFFRHVRNAASYGNRFSFSSHEPSRPAAWRGRLIDEKSQGATNPLHGQPCFGKYMGAADAIVMLWDVEQKL